MTSIIRIGQSPFSSAPIDEDSVERITTCLQSLANVGIKRVFLEDTQAAYTNMIAHEEKKAAEKKAKEGKTVKVQADDLISFRQFSKKAGTDADEVCRTLVIRL